MTTAAQLPPSGSSPRFPEFPALDGFRGLAILLVLVEHVLKYSVGIPGPWNHWGGVGVILFFALSGFLITGLLGVELAREGRIDLRAFWIRRGLRILPAMAAYLAAIALLKLAGWVTDPPWKDFAACLAFLRNFAGRGHSLEHLWSVSLEQQFYLLWPLVFAATGRRGARRASLAVLVGVIAWRAAAISTGLYRADSATIYLRSDFRFDALMGGSFLALAWHGGDLARSAVWLRSFASPWWVLPALLAWAGWMWGSPWAGPVFIAVQVLLALLLLSHLVSNAGDAFGWLCSGSWLRWLGRRSYSIYLWQQIFLVVKSPDWGWARHFPVDLALAFAFGLASYHWVELPCLRLKSRMGRRRSSGPGSRPDPA